MPKALEGWLNTAGYLPKDDLRNSRSRINDSISQASEPVRQHLSDLPGLHVQKLGDRRPSSLGARRTSRRASLLDESGYQNLASERAAAQAKLREDLRAVVSERWSEPLSADRRQHFVLHFQVVLSCIVSLFPPKTTMNGNGLCLILLRAIQT